MISGLMNYSAVSDLTIGEELENLFFFQDKHLGKEKKAAMVKEIMASGLPVEAIVRGIRSLKLEDIGSLKLTHIMWAIRKFVEASEIKTCDACTDGFIPMKDDEKRVFVLACRCPAGQVRRRGSELKTWNGGEFQDATLRVLGRNGEKIDLSRRLIIVHQVRAEIRQPRPRLDLE